MKSITPYHSLLLLVVIGLASLFMQLTWPKEGIGFGTWKLQFAQFDKGIDSTQIKLDMQSHMARLDSIALADSLRSLHDSVHVERSNSLTSLQFKDGNSHSFHRFFEALDSAQFKNVDVLHYGDSQIECDRITQILRTQLQQKFGGYGPGLIAPVPLVATSHILQDKSANWQRCTAYGYQDGSVNHKNFGIMCSFGKFDCPHPTDSTEATLEFMPTRFGDARNKTFHQFRMYYRNTVSKSSLSMYDGAKLIWSGDLPVSNQVQHVDASFDAAPSQLKLVFKALNSPEVHAIQLEEQSGVTVSNISLRGNDGMLFTRTDLNAMGYAYQRENTRLIILQFGGNSVPYIKSAEQAKSCAASMANQINALKKQAPEAAILFVGPSDMSTSIDGVYQSFPYLQNYNQALKEMVLGLDCAYWDMYEVMGGRNSMVSWVQNQPPYAGPDYIHFTPLGARKIADLLSKAILEEYRIWKQVKETQVR
jgi:lysophospholipase L1-like esterase